MGSLLVSADVAHSEFAGRGAGAPAVDLEPPIIGAALQGQVHLEVGLDVGVQGCLGYGEGSGRFVTEEFTAGLGIQGHDVGAGLVASDAVVAGAAGGGTTAPVDAEPPILWPAGHV